MANVRRKIYGGGGARNEADLVEVVWDYSADGGAIGSLELFEATKPCVVHLEHAHVKTAVAGTNLVLEVGKNGEASFASIPVASLTLDSMHACSSFSSAYEITNIACVADTSGSLNYTYFFINTPAGGTNYYVWINAGGNGTDPEVEGRTGVEIAIAEDSTDAQVATAIASALDALPDFSAPAPVDQNVVVTNSALGVVINATGDTGFDPGFTITTETEGAIGGMAGVLMADGDVLTQAIKTAAATAGLIKYVFRVYAV